MVQKRGQASIPIYSIHSVGVPCAKPSFFKGTQCSTIISPASALYLDVFDLNILANSQLQPLLFTIETMSTSQ